MAAAYARPRCAYFVVERDGRVCGGGGVAPLEGGDPEVCELRKMYFLPELRGLGAGAALMAWCLEAARTLGFRRCYLETLRGMDAAQKLGIDGAFRQVPPQFGYWLGNRAKRGFGTQPSTWQRGLGDGG